MVLENGLQTIISVIIVIIGVNWALNKIRERNIINAMMKNGLTNGINGLANGINGNMNDQMINGNGDLDVAPAGSELNMGMDMGSGMVDPLDVTKMESAMPIESRNAFNYGDLTPTPFGYNYANGSGVNAERDFVQSLPEASNDLQETATPTNQIMKEIMMQHADTDKTLDQVYRDLSEAPFMPKGSNAYGNFASNEFGSSETDLSQYFATVNKKLYGQNTGDLSQAKASKQQIRSFQTGAAPYVSPTRGYQVDNFMMVNGNVAKNNMGGIGYGSLGSGITGDGYACSQLGNNYSCVDY